MGHCNDGALEICQVPFPFVPVLGTKTCSFSEDMWHGTTCALILLDFPRQGSPVYSACENNLSPVPRHPRWCGTSHPWALPRTGHSPSHGPHPHLGLGTNTRQCLIKLLLNLFNLLLRAWRSSQQPAVWADVVCRGEQSTAVTECLQVTPGTVQGCRELQDKKMTKWINMEANLTGLEQLEQGVEDRGLKSLLWKV